MEKLIVLRRFGLRLLHRPHNLRTRLAKLDKDRRALLHPATGRYYITGKGRRDVEKRGLARPASV